jgi:tetratricopeptide (TPR) repeat protein
MDTTKRVNCCKLIDVLEQTSRRARRASTLRLVAYALSLFAYLPGARADGPSAEATAEARRSEAKGKFQEGVAAFGERRYQDAVRAFQQADAIQPSAALSFNIARAFERLDDTPAALRWYRDYLRRDPQAANAAEVGARVNELAIKLVQRGVQQLSVLSTPEGASVLIDQRPAGLTPLTTELAPGVHHFTLRAAGYRDLETDVTLDARTPRDVNLTLASAGAAPAATRSQGAVDAPDSRGAATSTPTAAAGHDRQARPFGVVPWLLLGAGSASMLGALGFELGRRSAESAAEQAPQRSYEGHFEAMQGRQTTARVLFAVGGALLVSGGTLLVLNTPKATTTKVALGCVGASCAVVARGSF